MISAAELDALCTDETSISWNYAKENYRTICT